MGWVGWDWISERTYTKSTFGANKSTFCANNNPAYFKGYRRISILAVELLKCHNVTVRLVFEQSTSTKFLSFLLM